MLYDRPTEAEMATTVWDDATGETWAEALARFAGFGPLIDAKAARTYLSSPHSTGVVMSFGYGDDPEYFDEVTLSDLVECCEDDAEADRDWGPFAIWHNPSLT